MVIQGNSPRLTAVVPATNTPPTLDRCTEAISAASQPPEQTIVVSEPGWLSASAARNLGAEQADGDVVVFIDADVEVHPDAFTRIRAAFENDRALSAVFGSYDDAPDVPTTVSTFRNLLHHHVHQGGAGPAETFWTGLGAVRRDAFLAAGGFDEARFPHPSVEDVDLGGRMRSAGARILLDPAIQGKHLKHWTLRSMLWTDFARRGVPWVVLQVRSGRASGALNLGWRHRLSAIASLAGVAGVVMRRRAVVGVALGSLLVLNRSFYALLLRRLGPVRAAIGVGLHVLHHLVSVLAVAAGLAVAVAERVSGTRSDRSTGGPER